MACREAKALPTESYTTCCFFCYGLHEAQGRHNQCSAREPGSILPRLQLSQLKEGGDRPAPALSRLGPVCASLRNVLEHCSAQYKQSICPANSPSQLGVPLECCAWSSGVQ